MIRRPKLRRPFVAAAAVVIAATALAVGVATASYATPGAGTLGTVTITPGSGASVEPFNLTTVSTGTTKGCLPGSTKWLANVSGPGAWATGFALASAQNAGVSTTADFTVPTSLSMDNVANNNKLTIVPGEYDITLICQGNLANQQFGTFIGAIYFTDATHWTATCSSTISGVTCTGATPTPTPSTTATPTPTPTPSSSATPTPTPTPSTSATPTPTPKPSTTATPTPTPTPSATATPTPKPSTTPTPTPTPSVSGTATTTTLTVYGAGYDGTSLIVRQGRSLNAVVTVTPTAAGGTVQVFDTIDGKTTAVGGPRVLRHSVRRINISGLSQGTHVLSAVFTPAAGSTYAKSTSKSITIQVVAGRTCRHHDDDDHSLAWRVRGAD